METLNFDFLGHVNEEIHYQFSSFKKRKDYQIKEYKFDNIRVKLPSFI